MAPRRGSNELFQAIEEGNHLKVRRNSTSKAYFSGRVSPSQKLYSINEAGNTPLHEAIIKLHNVRNEHGNDHHNEVVNALAIVEELVKSGAPLDKANDTGDTPLHLAAKLGGKNLFQKVTAFTEKDDLEAALEILNGNNQTALDIITPPSHITDIDAELAANFHQLYPEGEPTEAYNYSNQQQHFSSVISTSTEESFEEATTRTEGFKGRITAASFFRLGGGRMSWEEAVTASHERSNETTQTLG